MPTFDKIPVVNGKNVWSIRHNGKDILQGISDGKEVYNAFPIIHNTNPLTAAQLAEWNTTFTASIALADTDTVFDCSGTGTIYLDLYDYAEDGVTIYWQFTLVDVFSGDSIRFGADASPGNPTFAGFEHPDSPFFNGDEDTYNDSFVLDSNHRYLKFQCDSGDRFKFNNFILRTSLV